MLIETTTPVYTVKVNPGFTPPPDNYPHYRMIPMQTEAGRYHCLLFYISEKNYLILAPRLKRHLAIRRLKEFLKTAVFPVYEFVHR